MERFTDLLFLAQVALLFGALSCWLTPARHPARAMLVITAWVALLGYLSLGGYFADFRSLPPRILPALLLPLLAGFVLLRSAGARDLLSRTPPQWPIYAQSFRVVMELILWLLFLQHRVPAIMTFEGRNADILVGLTAIPVGYLCFVRNTWSPRVALWWNVAGILILLNVVVHAQLSTPSPLRVFVTDPPVTFIAYWPYILLPGFLVPLAWLLHAASLIQLRRSM
ncbi:MAG: hypothetical protein Q7W02_25840 [Candidatus Rokubacteria bacterium]|nr:hypothetical protein [Candidatus Rokubacteria bacterium]